MKQFTINLNEVENVKKFVEIANNYDTDIIVNSYHKKFAVDARSIMGIFSLDLSKPVIVCISDDTIADQFINEVRNNIKE